ncbi:MAG: TIGR03663 family protein [Chloroflexi bacterium CFX4]|nr:TIGR03663 family protein [Chloroflexi bacterium CFX4]MDL1921258.1 TIGR03663 family protein [Chloroflexi bacterium CFX3]
MATLDQAPLHRPPAEGSEQHAPTTNVLNSAFARVYTLNWELIFYLAILVIAIFTRFVNLGDRVMSHDESLHTKYSHDLYKQGNFQHTPLMHGPVLFHATALSYFLFGDSDFSARLYPAILGIIMVLMPKLLFERWLGKLGAMAASVLILISPMLLFHHRYIREDTPAIFFTMLMAYAVFAYIDGVIPRQPKFLVLLAVATLLNLASKETAFMYILIFAGFLGLFLLMQLLQSWRRASHSPAVGWAVLGVALVPIAGGAATLLLRRLNIDVGGALPEGLLLFGDSGISQDVALMFVVLLLGVPLALGILLGIVVLYRVLFNLLNKPLITPIMRDIAVRGRSAYMLALSGILIGAVAALVMTNVFSIIPPETISASQAEWQAYEEAGRIGVQPISPEPNALIARFALWSSSLALILLLAVLLTATQHFSTQEAGAFELLLRFAPLILLVASFFLSGWLRTALLLLAAISGALLYLYWRNVGYRLRLPLAEIITMAVIAIAVFALFIFVEERSRRVENVSSEVRPVPTSFENYWIFGAWVIGIVAVIGIAWLRSRTTFWQEMRRYAAFDIIIVLGSLVLPWSAALPIFLAGYPLDGSFYAPREINAMILGVIPFVLVSVAAGLAWRPGLWLTCTAAFYGVFAFFFTTMFTNPQGVATGVVGSLGYWLAQQGVRRGGQPQYYYMLIQLPIYEYLVTIGAMFAGVLGLSQFWKFRAERYAAVEAERAEREAADAERPEEDDPFAPPEDARAETLANAQMATQAQGESPFEPVEEAQESAPPDNDVIPTEDEKPKKKRLAIPEAELVTRPLFNVFVGFWGVLILFALTLAGEKMPWLTTHIALPFALSAGWYLGTLLEKVDWAAFWRRSWALIFLIPIAVFGAVNVIGLLRFGVGGLSREQQLQTFAWFGAIILTGIVIYAIVRILQVIGIQQTVRVGLLGFFALLAVLTARHAWMAAYINYDTAAEFMVYAHAAPANKTVINYIEEISRRTTDGMAIRVGYDNEVSWPGSWYFRNFPNGRYLGDLTGGIPDIDQYVALMVGANNSTKIAAQVGDKFYRFDMIRLWWPMQEYFGLTLKRVDDAFADPEMTRALWDIWWNRDYTTYTRAYQRMTGNTGTSFTLDKWPVSDRLAFFVRKDVAAQLWDFGVGTARVSGLPEDPFAELRCDTCAAEFVLPAETALNAPRGLAIGADGMLYVADTRNGRILIYDADGRFQREFGTPNTSGDPNIVGELGVLREPWGIAVDSDGVIYVADTWHHRVQVFANDGAPLRAWGTFEQAIPEVMGSAVGFYGPRDIKVDSRRRVYVADTGNKRVRVYDQEGNWLYDIGQRGTELGALFEPVGLAINERTNEIFVASTWNKRVDVFTLEGQYVRSWEIMGWYGTTPSQDSGNRPYLALDPSGNYLFVTDPDVGRVLVYDTLGNPALAFGRLGAAPFVQLNQFGVLGGIAFDGQGRLFLSDAGGGRLLRFGQNAFPGLMFSAISPRDFDLGVPTEDAAPAELSTEEAPMATPEATSRDF